jgi:hypothetical protein
LWVVCFSGNWGVAVVSRMKEISKRRRCC